MKALSNLMFIIAGMMVLLFLFFLAYASGDESVASGFMAGVAFLLTMVPVGIAVLLGWLFHGGAKKKATEERRRQQQLAYIEQERQKMKQQRSKKDS